MFCFSSDENEDERDKEKFKKNKMVKTKEKDEEAKRLTRSMVRRSQDNSVSIPSTSNDVSGKNKVNFVDEDTNLSHDNDDIKLSKGTKRKRGGRATASTVNNKSKNKVKNDEEEDDEGLIKLILILNL